MGEERAGGRTRDRERKKGRMTSISKLKDETRSETSFSNPM